ncbi:MAG: ABC transporter substrate-binding protein, partial [Bacteroidota bacterium]|nr:ABC transporter substrate-binding protein [Bacteroidota bacterium]
IEVDADNKPSFKALNDSVLKIKLKKPFPPFLNQLSLKYCSVIPHEAVKKYGKEFREHPVGTGPFILRYFIEGEKIILHPNPRYFETDKAGRRFPFLDAVVISFVSSKQNEFLAFLRGDLSIVSGLDQSFKDELLSRNGNVKQSYKDRFRVEKNPFLNTEYLGIQLNDSLHKGSPLLQKKVRQAIHYAIDRQKMVKYLRNNIGTPATAGFVPPYLLPEDTSQYFLFDPAKSRALLQEAGYPNGKGLGEIGLMTTIEYLDLAVYVQKELQQIGLKVKINNVEASTLKEWKAQGKAPFFRASWIADYADAENYLSLFYSRNFSPGGPNYFHYYNAQFDRLFELALLEEDFHSRQQLYVKMQSVMMDDAPVIVLYYDVVVRLIANNVEGLNTNPINLIDLKTVKMR